MTTKVTVKVQNRHLQRAIAAYEKRSAVTEDISRLCPMHQAVEEMGLITGGFDVQANEIRLDPVLPQRANPRKQQWIRFSPPLGDELYLNTDGQWQKALTAGKEYEFTLEMP